jgi:hypothetical protein
LCVKIADELPSVVSALAKRASPRLPPRGVPSNPAWECFCL